MPLMLDRDNSQGFGSALTYARRYALTAVLGLVADDDDDGAAASTSERTRRQPQPHATATPAPASQPAVKPRPPTATEAEVRAIRESANDKPLSPLSLVAIVVDVSGIDPPTLADHMAGEAWLGRMLPHLPSEHVAGVLNAVKNTKADV
jgi:hypothetical protein